MSTSLTYQQQDKEQQRAGDKQLSSVRQASSETARSIDSGQDSDRRHKVVIVTSLYMYKLDKEVARLTEKESKTAKPLGLPVELLGQPCGPALIDPGATRSIIRKEVADKINASIVRVNNVYVLGATCHEIPVVGKILVDVTSNERVIGRVLFYVIDDSTTNDFVCDIVIGRASLANGAYPLVDTSGDGAITQRYTNKSLPCTPCSFIKGVDGRRQLVADTDIENLQVPVHSIIEEEKEQKVKSNRQIKLETRKTKEKLRKDKRRDKVLSLMDVVGRSHHLTPTMQEHVLTYLITHVDSFEVAPTTFKEAKMEQHNVENSMRSTREQICMLHCLQELEQSSVGSEEEKKCIENLFAVYVPEVVKNEGGGADPLPTTKSTTSSNTSASDKFQPSTFQTSSSSEFHPSKTSATTNKENEDEVTVEEVEDIEFPLTPPPSQTVDEAYKKERIDAITKMVLEIDHLSPTEKQQLVKVLVKHADRFSIKGENMGKTNSSQHEIDTGDAAPFRERLRAYSPVMQQIIDIEVQRMIKEGVLVPSRSPYASNLLLVRKPDASSEGGVKNRVCASFVRLNQQTRKDSYPLPVIQYIFDKIGSSSWFTTMDLLSGFWQVMIKPEHRHKTAVITMRGLYEFMVMPFGLCNAPATFQRLMDSIILPEFRSFIETYIDDLMTHSKTFDDHLSHIDTLLTLLTKHNLMVKLSKCKFAQRIVKFLGHLISHNSIRVNPQTIEAINKWMRPAGSGKKAVTAVRGFLGMSGWFRKFIRDYARLAKPLYTLTKKDYKWEWTEECQRAFDALKLALTTAPVLTTANPNKVYILHTDASDYAMGAILMQEDDNGDLHVVAYASKTFSDTESRYDTTEREALAIIWALEHFNTYVEGHQYTIITDHQALSFIKQSKDNKRVHRWNLKLSHYHLDIIYKKGADNHAADLLSRKIMVLVGDPKEEVPAAPMATRQSVKQKQKDESHSGSSSSSSSSSSSRRRLPRYRHQRPQQKNRKRKDGRVAT